MRSWLHGGVAGMVLLFAQPAQAEVLQQDERGFVVRVTAEVAASQADAWRAMTTPSGWWANQHTFSGDAANLTLDPVAGGCFCEKLPVPKDAPAGQRAGSVQHMRVIYAEPVRALRLSGALGPLQSEALTGTLTMTLKPTETGTRILFEYVVGGYMRYKHDEIAPAVDRMLAGQVTSLAAKLGEPKPAASPSPKPKVPAAPAGGEAAARDEARAAFDAAALGRKDPSPAAAPLAAKATVKAAATPIAKAKPRASNSKTSTPAKTQP